MSDYLQRLALRAAGLESGRPAPAPDLPPMFGFEAEPSMVAVDALKKEPHVARAPSREPDARRVERTVAEDIVDHVEPRVETSAIEEPRTSRPAEARAPSATRAEPRRTSEAAPPSAATPREAAARAVLSQSGLVNPARVVDAPAGLPDSESVSQNLRGAQPVMVPSAADASPRATDLPVQKQEASRRVAPGAVHPATAPIRILAEPPAPAPLESPPAAVRNTVEVSVNVGRVIVRQEFAPALPPAQPAERPASAFAGQSLARRHVDRRWY